MMYGSIPDVELRRFYSLWRDMALVYDEWSKARRISDSAVLVLHSLYYERGGCTQKMICDKWLFPKQTVNSILKDFERRGLIEFSTLESDRRNKQVRLTPAGDDLAGSLIPELSRLERFVMEKMGEEGRRGLIEGMALFVKYFREGSPACCPLSRLSPSRGSTPW